MAGRIPGGLLKIESREFQLACNDLGNHLHGGRVGLDNRIWSGEKVTDGEGSDGVCLSYVSPDGEEGYPGEVSLAATYWLTAAGELVFETEVRSDRVTPVTLAQHGCYGVYSGGAKPGIRSVKQGDWKLIDHDPHATPRPARQRGQEIHQFSGCLVGLHAIARRAVDGQLPEAGGSPSACAFSRFHHRCQPRPNPHSPCGKHRSSKTRRSWNSRWTSAPSPAALETEVAA